MPCTTCGLKARGESIAVFRPRSIAFGRLTREQAQILYDTVAEVIHVEIGLDWDAARIEAHLPSPLNFGDELRRKAVSLASP